MSKVTSKLQVTLPKALAEAHGIHPGDEIEWGTEAGKIFILPVRRRVPELSREERLKLFDESTARQRERNKTWKGPPPKDRGWTREELYERGRSR